MAKPTPHKEKLEATLVNEALPSVDKPRIETALKRYNKWITDMGKATGAPEQRLAFLVKLLNEYRMFVDLELIFDSPENFLYRLHR